MVQEFKVQLLFWQLFLIEVTMQVNARRQIKGKPCKGLYIFIKSYITSKMSQKKNFYNARLLIYENTAIQHIGSILCDYLHLPFLGVHNEFLVQSALKNSVER
jgi:hypothetical protein